MPLKQTYDDVPVPLTADVTQGDKPITEVEFLVTLKKGTTTTDEAPVKKPVASNKATYDFGAKAVEPADDFYELTYKVRATPSGGTASTAEGKDTVKVWPKNVKVKFTSDDGEAHKGCKFRIRKGTAVTEHTAHATTGEWEGDVGMNEWAVEVAAPWEKAADTKPTGRSREYKVTKQKSRAKFVKPNPADPAKAIRQYVNLAAESGGWTRAKPYGSTVTFDVATVSDLGDAGTVIFIEVAFGCESDRTKPKPALLDTGLEASTLKEDTPRKKFTGQVKLDATKKASFKVQLGYAGGDTATVKIGTTKACEDATLKFVNWRKIWFENLHPAAELSNFTAALGATTTDYLQEVLNGVFIEWVLAEQIEFAAGDLTDLDKNAYGAELWGGSVGDKILVLTLDTLKGILGVKAKYSTYDTVVSMIWCDLLANKVKAWTQSFADLEGETGDLVPVDNLVILPTKPVKPDGVNPGGPFAITKVAWRATKWQDGSTWRDITSADDPGGAFRTLKTLTSQADIEAHLVIERTTKIRLKFPAGTSPGNASYPAKCLSVVGSKFKAQGLTAAKRPVVEFAADKTVAAGDDGKTREIGVKEVNQGQTHTVVFKKKGLLGDVPTELSPDAQDALDTWILTLCDLEKLKTSDNKLRFEISGPTGNSRRTDRIANVKSALTDRTAAVAPQQKFPTPAKPVRIEVLVEGSGCICNINGAAQYGNIWMQTSLGNAHDIGKGSVLMHELGHNMGQGYADQTTGLDTVNNWQFGRPNAIDGLPFPPGVPGGDIYAGKGHTGAHCAHGVGNKAATDYSNQQGDCIMFGSGDMNASTKGKFCDNCIKYIKAENLTSIRRVWTNAVPAESAAPSVEGLS